MKRFACIFTLLLVGAWGQPAAAQGLLGGLGGLVSGLTQTLTNTVSTLLGQPQAVIVRTNLGLAGLQNACLANGCTVVRSLDGGNQLYLVKPAQGLIPDVLAAVLRLVTGILDAEPDQLLTIPPSTTNQPYQTTAPTNLFDQTPVNYFGTTVWNGYANQPAAQIINIDQAQDAFNVSGKGIVADIDTGVDPNHPALKSVLLPGYDFTRNQPGGSEMTDLGGSSGSACSACQAAFVNQHTAAMLDQHTAAMLDGSPYPSTRIQLSKIAPPRESCR